MEKPLKNTWEIYTGKFEKIIILMLTTTLPLLMVHSFITNYIYVITPSDSPIYSFADIYYGLLTLLFFLYAQFPYIQFIYNEYLGVGNNLRNSIYQFLENGLTVFIFACVVAIFSAVGFAIYIIPGLILLTIVFPVPYISIFDKKSVWRSYKEGIRIGKKKFFKILLLLTVTGSIEYLFGIFITYQLFEITSSFLAQIITQITINLLCFPFIIMLLTSYIIKWRESMDVLEISLEDK